MPMQRRSALPGCTWQIAPVYHRPDRLAHDPRGSPDRRDPLPACPSGRSPRPVEPGSRLSCPRRRDVRCTHRADPTGPRDRRRHGSQPVGQPPDACTPGRIPGRHDPSAISAVRGVADPDGSRAGRERDARDCDRRADHDRQPTADAAAGADRRPVDQAPGHRRPADAGPAARARGPADRAAGDAAPDARRDTAPSPSADAPAGPGGNRPSTVPAGCRPGAGAREAAGRDGPTVRDQPLA